MKMVGMKMRSVSPVPGNKTSTRTPVKRGSTGDRTTTPASKRSGNRGASGTSTRRGSPVAVAKARPAMRRSKSLSPPKMKKKGIASVISSAAVRPKLSTKMTSRTTSTSSATTTAARTSPSSMKSTPPSSPWSGAKMKTPSSVRNAAAAPAAAMKKEKLAAAPSSSSSSSTKNANSRLNKQVVKTAVKIVRRRSMPATTGGDGKSNKISSSRSSVGKKQTPTSTSKKERVSEGGDGSCINKGHSAPSSSGAVAPASTNRDDTDWSASSTTASTPSSSTRGAAAAGTFIGNGNATNISAFLVNTSGRQEPQQDPASVFAPATHTAHLTSSSSSSSSELGGGCSLCQFRPRGILKKVSSSGSAGNTSSRAKVDEHHRLEHDKVPGTTSTMPPTTGSTSSSGTRAFKSEVQDLADTFAAKLALPPTNANLMLVEDSQTLHEDAADPRATHKIKINSQRKQKHATWKQSLLDDVGGAGLLQASGSSCSSSSSSRNDAGERTAGPRAASVDRNQEIRMSQLEKLDDEDGHHAPDRNREITISELFDEETRGWAGSNAASSSAANRNDHPKKPKVGDTSHDPHAHTFSPENKNRQRKSVRFAQMPAERHTYEDVYDEGFFMGRRTWFQSPYEHQKTQMEFLLLSSPEEWEKSSMYVANQKKRREKFRQLTGMGVGGDHDCWAPTSLDDVDDELHPGQVLEHDAPANNLNFDENEDADEEDEGEERDHGGGYYDVDAPRSRNSSRSPEPRDRTTGASMGSAASSQVEMAEPTPFTPEQRAAGSSSSSSRNVGGAPGASLSYEGDRVRVRSQQTRHHNPPPQVPQTQMENSQLDEEPGPFLNFFDPLPGPAGGGGGRGVLQASTSSSTLYNALAQNGRATRDAIAMAIDEEEVQLVLDDVDESLYEIDDGGVRPMEE